MVVEADQAVEIIVAVEFDSFGAQDAREGFVVERLGVGERAVEVEDDCADHYVQSCAVSRVCRVRIWSEAGVSK